MKLRPVNAMVLDLWKECLNNNTIPLLIYSAPTGYGKTELMPYLFKGAYEGYYVARLIHASPSRSLVERIFNKKYRGRLLGLFKSMGLSEEDITYQAMSLFALESKDAYFAGRVVVTTIDSLFMNQFKLCVPEMIKTMSHYEEPRSFIATSMIAYDEAHLYGGDPGVSEFTSLLYFYASLLSAVNKLRPIAVISATLPEKTLDYMTSRVKQSRFHKEGKLRILKVNYGEEPYIDKDFDELVENMRWHINLVSSKGLKKVIKELLNMGYKLLIVRNTPEAAVSTYTMLSSILPKDVTLIHGRFTLKDRDKLSKNLEEQKVVIATQVIEVGLDLDADVLISDPIPLSQLIQRSGRVCRDLVTRKNRENKLYAYIYILEDGVREPYENMLIERTMNLIKERSVKDLNLRKHSVCSDLLRKVYGEESLKYLDKHINEVTSLIGIDSSPKISKLKVKDMLIERIIPLIRGSLILPVYVGEEDKPSDTKSIINNSVPVSLSWIKKHLDTLSIIGGRVEAYFAGFEVKQGEESIVLDSINLEELLSVNAERLILTLIFDKGLIALKGRRDKYNPIYGLVKMNIKGGQ